MLFHLKLTLSLLILSILTPAVQAGVIENLESIFKINRGEKPIACRFDLTFDETKKRACESLEYTTLVVREHLSPRDTTDPLFFEVFEKLPEACLQYRHEAQYKDHSLWPCLFWGIREKVKYEIVSELTSCGGNSVVAIQELDFLYESCSQEMKEKYGLAGSLDPISKVCRADEYLKFKSTIKDRHFLTVNSDLLLVSQPGFSKEEAPDYFYLLNSCDKRKVKRKKKFAAVPVPKIECVDDSKPTSAVLDLTQKTFPVLAEIEKQDSAPDSKLSAIKASLQNILTEKLKEKDLPPKTKDLFFRMLKDKGYLDKTAEFYKDKSFPEIKKSFEKELEKTKEKILASSSHEYSLEEQKKLPGAEVLVEEKEIKPVHTPAPTQAQVKVEEKQENPDLKKELEELAQTLAVEVPVEAKKQVEEFKKEKNAPPLKSKDQLIQDATKALEQYKATGKSDLNLAEFFMASEFEHYDKKDEEKWKKDFVRLDGWKKHVQKKMGEYQKRGLSPDWRRYEIVKDLNLPFLKQYARGAAFFSDCFSGRGCNCEGQTKFLTSFLQMAGYKPSSGNRIVAQVFSDHIQLVEWDKNKNEVKNILTGEVEKGIVAPLYDPHVLAFGYLRKQGLKNGFSEKDFLVAEKNVVDPKNKGQRSRGGSNTNLKLPSSDVSFAQGREIPERALISSPINPDQAKAALKVKNPMAGLNSKEKGIGGGDDEIPSVQENEEVLRRAGFKTLLTPGTHDGVVGIKIRTKPLKPEQVQDILSTVHNEVKKKGVFGTPRFIIAGGNGRGNYYETEIYFRNASDEIKFNQIEDLMEKFAYLAELNSLDESEFFNSVEVRKALDYLANPSLILEKKNSALELKEISERIRKIKKYNGVNFYFQLQSVRFFKNKNGKPTLDMYPALPILNRHSRRWEKLTNPHRDFGINARYRYQKTFKQLSDTLTPQVMEKAEDYIKFGSRLSPEQMLAYYDLLSTVIGDMELSIIELRLKKAIERTTFEVSEKGISEKVVLPKQEKKKSFAVKKQDEVSFEGSDFDDNQIPAPAPKQNRQESQNQKPEVEKQAIIQKQKSGIDRDEPNENKEEADIKVSAIHYLAFATKANFASKLTSAFFKEVEYLNKDGKYDSIIEKYLDRLFHVGSEGGSLDGLHIGILTDEEKMPNDFSERIQLSRDVEKEGLKHVPLKYTSKAAWKVFYEYFKRNPKGKFHLSKTPRDQMLDPMDDLREIFEHQTK